MYRAVFLIAALLSTSAYSRALNDAYTAYIPANEAFQVSVEKHRNIVFIQWDINKCCKVYYDKIVIEAGGVIIPQTEYRISKLYRVDKDMVAGYSKVMEGTFSIGIENTYGDIKVKYQGCNVGGFCYPPQRIVIEG